MRTQIFKWTGWLVPLALTFGPFFMVVKAAFANPEAGLQMFGGAVALGLGLAWMFARSQHQAEQISALQSELSDIRDFGGRS